MLRIIKENESWIKLSTNNRGDLYEIREYFSFKIDGAKWHPKVKAGLWDGVISLIDLRTNRLPCGLLDELVKFCKKRNIEYSNEVVREDRTHLIPEIEKFCKGLQPCAYDSETRSPVPITHYDYQVKAVITALVNKRRTLLSATSSGKSLIIYSAIRWILEKELTEPGEKILLIVPTVSLVDQMYSDFNEYSLNNGFDVEENVHKIYGGQSKGANKPIYISTWQSLQKMDENYLSQFRCIVGDEAHGINEVSHFGKIGERCINADFRIGTTGSIKDMKLNEWVLTGILGDIERIITNKELIDAGHAAKLQVECLILNYPKDVREAAKKLKYQEEVKYVISNEARNKFICKVAAKTKKNTLILFNLIAHGKELKRILEEQGQTVYYVDGSIDPKIREEIRQLTERNTGVVIVASYKTFATGTSIKNLNYLILAAPAKSQIRILQSLGRLLRKGNDLNVKLIDIADDLSYKKHTNFCLLHFQHRLNLYIKEQFPYNIRHYNIS